MNIMLTDIRSLTLEAPEVPVVAQADPDGFAGLLHRHSPQTTDESNQVIEFKDFIETSPMPTEPPPVALQAPPEAVWREFLSQDSIKVTTAAEPLPNTTLQVVDIVPRQPWPAHSEQTIELSRLTSPGNGLPAGGNELPLSSAIPRADLSAEMVKISLAAVSTPASQQLAAVTTPLASASTTESAQSAVRVPAPVTAQVAINTDASAITNELRDVVVAQTVVTRPDATAAPLRHAAADLKSVIKAGQSREGARTRQPTDLSELLNTRPVTQPETIGAKPVATELPGAGSVSKEQIAIDPRIFRTSVDPIPAEKSAQRDIPVPDDSSRPLEARDGMRAPLPLGKPVTEAVAQEPVLQRGPDMPPPASNQAFQPSVASATTVQNANLNATVSVNAPPVNPLPAALETMTLSRNADTLEWGNGLSERVNWMVNQKQNTAMIRLDPPALGKLDVHIRMVDDATTITIQTQHAQTRDLIESASARLRDILQDSGYQNVNVDVSQRQNQSQAHSQSSADANPEQADELDLESAAAADQNAQSDYFVGDGIVDTFA